MGLIEPGKTISNRPSPPPQLESHEGREGRAVLPDLRPIRRLVESLCRAREAGPAATQLPGVRGAITARARPLLRLRHLVGSLPPAASRPSPHPPPDTSGPRPSPRRPPGKTFRDDKMNEKLAPPLRSGSANPASSARVLTRLGKGRPSVRFVPMSSP